MSLYSSSEIRNSAALEAEAEFGLCCIEQFCMTLRADSSVLEVGSGPGLLLSNLHKNLFSRFYIFSFIVRELKAKVTVEKYLSTILTMSNLRQKTNLI